MERTQRKNVLLQRLHDESMRRDQEKHEQVTKAMIDLKIQREESLKIKEEETTNTRT